MVIRRQKVAQVQKAPAANDNLPTTTPPPAAPTARLVKGECVASMEAMAAGSVDLVVTSPPYLNIGMPYGDTFASVEDYIEFSRQWITAATRVLKPGGSMWINVGMHKAGPNSRVPITYYLFPLIAGTGLTLVQEIVWDRRAQQNTTQRFSTRSERWLYLVKPGVLKGGRGRPKTITPTFNLDDVRRPSTSADKRNNPAGANPADIWAFTQVHGTAKERTGHPCPFPQAMIERIVLACSNLGDVVLDPFGGSGTTGAAAIDHGRSAVLIEREPTYWRIIEKRLGLVDRHVVGKAETGVELFAEFHEGDAIEKMKLIPSKSVNLILVDPPYGTTNCEWDQTLPVAEMWREYKRILAPNGMIVIHAAQPFSIDLILSNRPWFIAKGDTILDPKRYDPRAQEFTPGVGAYDRVLANPPFSQKVWGHEVWTNGDPFGRDEYGVPPKGYGDLAFVQHMIASLKDDGILGVVVPHGVLFRGGAEGRIREAMLKADIIEAVIGLAPNLFYGAGIPAAILIIRKAKPAERRGKVLVVNGDATFTPGKAQNHLTDANVQTLADAFHGFANIEKLARAVPVEEIADNGSNLNISRYVQTGADAEAVDVAAEVAKLQDLIAKRNEAEAVMFGHLKRLGYVE